jgi:hypothetical protein
VKNHQSTEFEFWCSALLTNIYLIHSNNSETKSKTQAKTRTSCSRGGQNRKMTKDIVEESPRSLEQELLNKKVRCISSIPNLDSTNVRFTAQITVHDIISRDEYTHDEIERCWWTYDERKRLIKKQIKIVDRLEDGKKEKRSSPYRGLEKVAIAGYQDMIHARNRYVDSVMDEQEKQWLAGMEWLDWDRIADLVKDDCSESSEEALVMGRYDERQAQDTYECVIASSEHIEDTTETSTEDADELTNDGSNKLQRCRSSLPLIRQCSSKKKNKKKKRKSLRRGRGDPPGKILSSTEFIFFPIPSAA